MCVCVCVCVRMATAAAALLDELMGRSRNVIPGKEAQELDWSDAEVLPMMSWFLYLSRSRP